MICVQIGIYRSKVFDIARDILNLHFDGGVLVTTLRFV